MNCRCLRTNTFFFVLLRLFKPAFFWKDSVKITEFFSKYLCNLELKINLEQFNS